MNKDRKILLLLFSWNKKIYGMIVFIVWCLLGPYLYFRGKELIMFNGEISIYINYLIKFLGVILIVYLFIFFKRFLEVYEMEITYSIDRRLKLRYLIYAFIIFQLIILPIYIISISLFREFYMYLELLLIQQLFLLSMFYLSSYILKNTFISFGITIVFLMIMISVLPDVSSPFMIDEYLIDKSMYLIKYGFISLIFILVGSLFEKRFYQ